MSYWFQREYLLESEKALIERLTNQGKCLNCEALLKYHEHNCGYTHGINN